MNTGRAEILRNLGARVLLQSFSDRMGNQIVHKKGSLDDRIFPVWCKFSKSRKKLSVTFQKGKTTARVPIIIPTRTIRFESVRFVFSKHISTASRMIKQHFQK